MIKRLRKTIMTILLSLSVLGTSLCMPVTAYASDIEKNSMGEVSRLKGRFLDSLDLKGQLLRPHYFDTSMLSTFSSWYSIVGLEGFSAETISNMIKTFNALIDHGYSEAMAIGACGNMLQENAFRTSMSGNTVGIIQWCDSDGCKRKTQFLNYCTSKNLKWDSIEAQIEYLLYELSGGYDRKINNYLANYAGGSTTSNITSISAACDAFCVVMEGCVCYSGNKLLCKAHGSSCGIASNGKSYQDYNTRQEYSRMIQASLTRLLNGGLIGGSFAGMSRSDVLSSIYGYSSLDEIWAHTTYAQRSSYQVTRRLCDGRSITGNKYVIDDLVEALNEIIESGFPVDSTTYCYSGDSRSTYSGKHSFHALGLAVDINCGSGGGSWGWKHNAQFPNDWKTIYTQPSAAQRQALLDNYKPFLDPYAITTNEYNILKSHGWLWGRDFGTGSRPDLMHFSVGEVSNDGARSYISEICESYYRSYKTKK